MANITKSNCNKCHGNRNHEVLHREESKWEEEVDNQFIMWHKDVFEMLKCCGCDSITLRHGYTFSEDRDESGKPITSVSHYPSAIYRHKPQWFHESFFIFGFEENVITGLLHEIYVALQNDMTRLAAMGVRALVEHIIIEKAGDQLSFKENLKRFHEKGFISSVQKETLETILEVGHATIHRAFNPSKTDLITLMDVAETIIESIYINEHNAKQLKGRIPPRKFKKDNESLSK